LLLPISRPEQEEKFKKWLRDFSIFFEFLMMEDSLLNASQLFFLFQVMKTLQEDF
jgi:hypothetical protein